MATLLYHEQSDHASNIKNACHLIEALPVLVNTTWEAYVVFDECTKYRSIKKTYRINSHPSNKTYPGHQVSKAVRYLSVCSTG